MSRSPQLLSTNAARAIVATTIDERPIDAAPARRATSVSKLLRTLASIALIGSVAGMVPDAHARRDVEASAPLGTISVAELPPQGREVLAAIHAGGPFVFRRDGIAFGNREGKLPPEPRGYYAEYTVPTPGAGDRGARRIITGRGATGDRDSNEYYYTNDHYQSFRRILQ